MDRTTGEIVHALGVRYPLLSSKPDIFSPSIAHDMRMEWLEKNYMEYFKDMLFDGCSESTPLAKEA